MSDNMPAFLKRTYWGTKDEEIAYKKQQEENQIKEQYQDQVKNKIFGNNIEYKEYLFDIQFKFDRELNDEIIEHLDKLSAKYQNWELLENREVCFYNHEVRESVFLAPLFFKNSDYFVNQILGDHLIDFDLINSEDFIRKLFILENINEAKEIFKLSKNYDNNEDKFRELDRKFQIKCEKNYSYSVNLMDPHYHWLYETEFLKKAFKNKITLENLYEMELEQKNITLENLYSLENNQIRRKGR